VSRARKTSRIRTHRAFPASALFLILICGFALLRAIGLRWVTDDAFISFRYAQNLVRGHGLVFNVGERVEGYTNFLWTVVIAAGMKLGIDPILFTQILGLAGFVATIVVLAVASRSLFRSRSGTWIPFAGLACALHRDLQVWATGGLETSWVTLAITIGVVLLAFARENRAVAAAGLVLVAAILLRPDAIMAYAGGFAFLLLAGPRRPRTILAFSLPLLLVFLPYWGIRAAYYGHFYPNTYYAKSAHLVHYAQGLKYATLYGITYVSFPILILVALLSVIVLVARSRRGPSHPEDRLLLLASMVVLLFTAYVIRVGGDFMFGRFLVTITPLAFLAGECALHRFIVSAPARTTVGLALALSVLLRPNVFAKETIVDGIADERSYYPPESVLQNRRRAERLREILGGTGVKVAFYGGYASYAYYSEVDPAIEATTGLTDEHIAHQPIAQRGRVGHEKTASTEYLTQRGVQIVFRGPPVPGKYRWLEEELRVYRPGMFWLQLGDYPATLMVYDHALMEKLKRFEDVEFFDLPRHLDQYLAGIDKIPAEQVEKDYAFLKRFYFSVNDDRLREAKIIARIQHSRP